jgi:hypothetical protein
MEKKMTLVLCVFGVIVLGIILGARTSYVPFEELESIVVPYSSILILFVFIVTFTFFRGTIDKPAGFKYLAVSYKKGNYKQFFLSLIAIPVLSFIMGYFLYMVVATLPAYPTKMLTGLNQVTTATCLRTGRDKTRGRWSLFRLRNGEEWKVAGFGHVCPNSKKYCDVYYMTGIAGYYVNGIKCS